MARSAATTLAQQGKWSIVQGASGPVPLGLEPQLLGGGGGGEQCRVSVLRDAWAER